ncbi:MAG: hypothetical protein ACRC50_00390 [Gaiella sp.]
MRNLALLGVVVGAFMVVVGPASANHAWGSYHWARTSNPFTIKVVDANTSAWDTQLNEAIAGWNNQPVLYSAFLPRWTGPLVLSVAREAGSEDKRCRPVSGKVKSCNGSYGQNGWLGLAQIWLSGGHISQGTAKMNDTYFSMSRYNDPVKRQHVMCQEIGHTWGLGHQDESGADLNTCMDYSSALDNPEPNYHDFWQLSAIYSSHTDSTTTIATGLAGTGSAKPVRVDRNDRIADSVITEEYADGTKKVTHVFWALETRGHAAEHAFGHDD